MRTRVMLATTAVVFAGFGTSPALAAGNEQNGPTVGDCISDGFYGNEPNEVNGQTVPSQSPGPFVTDGGTVRRGATIGDANKLAKAAGFQNAADVCRTLGL